MDGTCQIDQKLYIRNPLVNQLVYVWVESEGGGGGGGSSFLDPPSKNLLGHSYKIVNTLAESSAQAQSIGTLFEQIGLRGRVCGHVQKSEAHALGCRPRESSQ